MPEQVCTLHETVTIGINSLGDDKGLATVTYTTGLTVDVISQARSQYLRDQIAKLQVKKEVVTITDYSPVDDADHAEVFDILLTHLHEKGYISVIIFCDEAEATIMSEVGFVAQSSLAVRELNKYFMVAELS